MAVGEAYGLKKMGGKERVFVLTSDGEQDEGQIWEAYLFVAHYKLDNLTVLIDKNQIQQSGKTDEVLSTESLLAKLLAFNFAVAVADGNNFASLEKAWSKIKEQKKPKVIICETVAGKGIKMIEGDYKWHAQNIELKMVKEWWQELEEQC